ncbi:MAG: acylphosphatase [Planctomycetota bacterium]
MLYPTLMVSGVAEETRGPVKRAIVHYGGRVQGVGFRYTTATLADRYAVAGYVQNLPDGRVRLVAEGAEVEVEGLLEAVSERMGRNIKSADVAWMEATGEFGEPAEGDTFGVRY